MNFSIEELIKQVISIYKDSNFIIVIDEAQLLSKDMIEIIRILADSKAFWFVLAMHKHESKKILNAPQFFSRPHKILELNKLQKSEYKDYIYLKLKDTDKPYLATDLNTKYLNFIYKHTKGNFREFKKLLHTTFLLLNYAQKNNKAKYQNLSKSILTMAAIQNGLIDV
jgi:DNA transposition AAA+ family ATPase